MTYTLTEKYELIKNEALKSDSKNPILIAKNIMKNDFVNIHGPEHHFLDGVSFMVAFKNAGGKIELEKALEELANRTIKMPGAMCGYWGVCGSVTALGACLSIINGTSPLSTDEFYKDNMEFTSSVVEKMSKIGGARCCKRNAFLSLSTAVKFVKEKYNVEMEIKEITCEFSSKNNECILSRCPFNKK